MPPVDLPRRRFGGVDPDAARRAIDEQRRMVADLTEHLARVEGQLSTAQAERDEARAQLAEMQGQIADVLRLATRAAQETEAETAERVARRRTSAICPCISARPGHARPHAAHQRGRAGDGRPDLSATWPRPTRGRTTG